MNHRSQLKIVLVLLLLGLIASCVRLPKHAQPRFYVPEKNDLASTKGFGYRQLAVKDFQAEALPSDYRQYNHRIGAQSCINMRPSRSSEIRIIQSYYHDMPFYVGTISKLTFEAIFVPDCSWWNPNLAKGRKEYVLQHEQIHFALTELAARKLTNDASHELKGYRAIGNTYSESQEELKRKLKTMVREAMEVGLEEHTDFDKDTSLFYDPRVQRRWLEKVDARLAE